MWRRASASEQDVIGHYSYTQYYRSHFQIIKSCESNEDQRSQTSREGTTLRWPHIVGIFLLGHLSVLGWYLGLTRVQGLCWKKRDQQSFYNLRLHWWAAVHGVAKSRTRLSDLTFTFHLHALEKEMATHSSILAWRIPGTEEPVGCRLWGHTDLAT